MLLHRKLYRLGLQIGRLTIRRDSELEQLARELVILVRELRRGFEDGRA